MKDSGVTRTAAAQFYSLLAQGLRTISNFSPHRTYRDTTQETPASRMVALSEVMTRLPSAHDTRHLECVSWCSS
jgi:hypothetical protein